MARLASHAVAPRPPARFVQQAGALDRVEPGRRYVGRVLRRTRRIRPGNQGRPVRGIEALGRVLPRPRESERPPHAKVREQRPLEIPHDHHLEKLGHGQDPVAGQEVRRCLRGLALIPADPKFVELASRPRLEPHRGIGNHSKDDLRKRSLRVAHSVAAHELQRLVRLPGFEAIRAASDGLAVDLRGRAVVRRCGDDGQAESEQALGVRVPEAHPDRRRVGRLDRGQVFEPPAPRLTLDFRIPDPLDREAHVIRRHRRPTLPRGPGVEMELVHEPVRRDGPGRSERRHGLAVGTDADEGTKDHFLDEQARLLRRGRGIQRSRVAGEMPEERRPRARGSLGAAARQSRQHFQGGETPPKSLHRRPPTE